MDSRLMAGIGGGVDSGAYTDLNRLNQLKVGDKNSDGNMRKVAQEFESLFLNEMLKSVRSATDVLAKDNPLNTETTKQYQQMYDQQLAVSLSREGGGIGLQDVLMRQIPNGICGSSRVHWVLPYQVQRWPFIKSSPWVWASSGKPISHSGNSKWASWALCGSRLTATRM